MVRRGLALLCWALVLAASPQPAGAAARVALVIGNSAYRHVPALPNAANDAKAVAALFRSSGFDQVQELHDVAALGLKRALREFEAAAQLADIAVVYFAGHGVEVGGVNYLIPVDARLASDHDVEDEAVQLDRVLLATEPARKLRLVILDACRDNPFGRSMRRSTATRSLGRGLGRIEPSAGDTLVAFSAKAGTVAQDGSGANSPFTAALIKHIATPGLDVRLAFGRIRDEVLRDTGNRQEPFVYGSLGDASVSLAAPLQPTGASATASPGDERADFELVERIGTRAAWEAFLRSHPTGRYADLAREQLRQMADRRPQVAMVERPDASPAPAPPPAAPRPFTADEMRSWDRIKDTNDPTALRDFIRRYPNSPLALLAQNRLEALEQAAREQEEARRRAGEAAARREPERIVEAETQGPPKKAPKKTKPPKAGSAPADAERAAAERRAKEAAERDRQAREAAQTKQAAGAQQAAQTVDRYPTIEAADRLAPGAKTTVLVSLTVDKVTPDVAIGATAPEVARTPAGALRVPMPSDRARIPLTVILHAPGFDLDRKTPQQATIHLDRAGDSTVARFDITARPGEAGARALRVTFWRDGEFLASASRKIEVGAPAESATLRPAPRTPSAALDTRNSLAGADTSAKAALPRRIISPEAVPLGGDRRPIDLTVEVVYDDPRTFSRGSVTVASHYFPRTLQGRFESSPDLVNWVEAYYREFRAEAVRDDSADTPAQAAERRDARLARLRAFGDELYRRAAPAQLKQALATLLSDQGVALRTIQIYTNNPLVPWELMRAPKPDGGSTDFFGIAFALARWHEDEERTVVRPLQDQPVEEVVAIAPSYAGAQSLTSTTREIEQIQALLATRHVAGRRSNFISLIRQPPSGIVHFAGHGGVMGSTPVERRFAIQFEDGLFDVMDWRGVSMSGARSRALFFFNACDVGQAESIAGVVDGWGPAALAKGASGYIGGLWPLRDDPAARFAVAFYQAISARLQQDARASVADALAQARKLVYETGDPTYLAYAFYGDAQLQFVRAR